MSTTISWEKEAEASISKVPAMIRPMVKKKVERRAKALNKQVITSELLSELRAKMMPASGSSSKRLEEFYAKTDAPPILAGFKRQNKGPHAGMGNMEPVENPATVWPKLSQTTDPAKKRALYIHIPFCLARCKFCSFYHSKTDKQAISSYVSYLMKELEMTAESNYARSTPFHAVYFGGGTPTDLLPGEFKQLLQHLNSYWNLANDCEITVEGRLFGFDDEKVEACLDNGVNRFSFGVQSFNTEIRRQMGRVMKREQLFSRLKYLVETGKANISADLIYGFPEQTDEIWLDDMRSVVESGVDSSSIYRLKLMDSSPIVEQVEQGKLSSPAGIEKQAQQFAASNEFFRNINAVRTGVTHWAFTNRERCIYNSISAFGGSCLPVGCGAGGNIGPYRVMQRMSLEQYAGMVTEGRKPTVLVSRSAANQSTVSLINGELALYLGTNLKEISRKTGETDQNERFKPLLRQWADAGMVNYNAVSGLLTLTDAGVFHFPTLSQLLLDYNIWKQQ